MQQQKNSFKALQLIHKAMLLGQILAAVIFLILIASKMQTAALQDKDRLFQVVAVVFSVAAVLIGSYLFKKKITGIKNKFGASIADKFTQYRTASIVQWALLEGATLFSCIAFFLVGNFSFLALAGVLIFLFAMLAPNKTKIAIQLGVGLEELEDL